MYKNKTIGIYCIENFVNKKVYVGQSVCIEKRRSQHFGSLRRNCNDNKNLQEDWNKYGESSFSFRLLETCRKDQLDERESFYVEKFKSNQPDFGYNFTNGGKKGFKHNPELLKLESEIQYQKYEDNPELHDLHRINALRQWSNPEIKAKILGANNGMYGKTHTPETREKLKQGRLGKSSARKIHIPVICIELNRRFDSACDASKEFSLNTANIYDVCKGKRKTCGGYTWKYAK